MSYYTEVEALHIYNQIFQDLSREEAVIDNLVTRPSTYASLIEETVIGPGH